MPPVIITMLRNKEICDKYDLSSVRTVFTGAAPLGKEPTEELQQWKPKWVLRQAYGMLDYLKEIVLAMEYPD